MTSCSVPASPAEPRAPRWLVWWLAAAPLFVLSCIVMVGGLATSKPWGDVGHYEDFARRILGGEVPYDDFYLEYPPGAVPVFVLPGLFTDGDADYLTAFKLLMTLCGLVALAGTARVLDQLRASTSRAAIALGAFVASPALLGWVFVNRYDLWPATFVVFALSALLAGRERLGSGVLALGFLAKVYAFAAVPVTVVHVWRTKGARATVAAGAVFAAVCLLATAFFLAVAFGGLGNSYWTQATRCLQIESLGASWLLVAEQLGTYESTPGGCSPGSIDLDGGLPDAVAMLSSVVQVAAVALVALAYLRGPESQERLVAAFAAAVAAFIVFAKVLSPQFLVWLVPLVPLVGGRRGQIATALFLVVLLLTQIELHGFVGVTIDDWAVWVLLVRNLLLVGLFGVLLSCLVPRTLPAARPAVAPNT
jgi:Glycosyltransferase family 87